MPLNKIMIGKSIIKLRSLLFVKTLHKMDFYSVNVAIIYRCDIFQLAIERYIRTNNVSLFLQVINQLIAKDFI